jgi:hypothetical protein
MTTLTALITGLAVGAIVHLVSRVEASRLALVPVRAPASRASTCELRCTSHRAPFGE